MQQVFDSWGDKNAVIHGVFSFSILASLMIFDHFMPSVRMKPANSLGEALGEDVMPSVAKRALSSGSERVFFKARLAVFGEFPKSWT